MSEDSSELQDIPSLNMDREDSFENLLKHVQKTPSAKNSESGLDSRPQSGKRHERNREQRQQRKIANNPQVINDGDEHLGEDFEDTPWLPPSIEKAEEFKKMAIFRNGDVRLDSVNLVTAPDLGSGVTLYFQFAMTMSLTLFFMSLLSFPALVFVYNGEGIASEDQDSGGLYRYTLGNLGYADPSISDARCTSSNYAYNDTCIHFRGSEISVSDAVSVMTAFEVIQIVVFFVGIFHLQRRTYSVTGKNTKLQTAISDYSVVVRDIPKDATVQEIIDHFSNLYQLDEKDFMGRPPVVDVRPVQTGEHLGDDRYIGYWVAECVVHKAIGTFISSFKSQQHLMEKLYRCRAKMKMYAENSPHARGHNLKRFLKAEKEMIDTGTKIDQITEFNMKKKKLKFISKDGDALELGIRPSTADDGSKTIYETIQAPSVSAYICFEYGESFARCVEDYTHYHSFPHYLFFPEKLKLRGHKLKIERAPEPDQIVWENIEVDNYTKLWLRLRTLLIAGLLVVGCFVIILQASIIQNEFQDSIPRPALCNQIIPELFVDPANPVSVSSMVLTRPANDEKVALDASCKAVLSDTFYAVFTVNGDLSETVGNYDISACTDIGICPIYDSDVFCPCHSITSSTSCEQKSCTTNPDEPCETFTAGSIGSCFCYDELVGNVNLNSGFTAFTVSEEACTNFYTEYTLSSGLVWLSIGATALINALLKYTLKMLAKQEAHTSSDTEQGSIMSKVFISNYVTMALIVLVAYGQAKDSPAFIKQLRFFVGPYSDFTRSWYGNIGFYLVTTYIFASFSPLGLSLFNYFLRKPILRWYHHTRVTNRTSHSIVMQHDLNMLEVGPVFDSTVQTAQLLTLLFFSMTFGAGLPLLMPLCCFTFAIYFRVDKLLLCRYYQKPPHIGDGSLKIVLSYLPWAAVFRLATACWMYGNSNILPDIKSNPDSPYATFLRDLRNGAVPYGLGFIQERVFRDNVFPLFCFFLLILFVKLIRKIWKQLPIYWALKFFSICKNFFTTKQDIFSRVDENGRVHNWDLMKLEDPLRQEAAPFTGEYFRFVKQKDEIPDTCLKMCEYAKLTKMNEQEIEEGWEVRDAGDFVIKVKVWKDLDNKKRRIGTVKKTYELIGDHRCSTYNVEFVPAYRLAIQGLREGATSVLQYQSKTRNQKNVDAAAYHDFMETDVTKLETNVIGNYKKKGGGLRSSFFNKDADDIEQAMANAVNGKTENETENGKKTENETENEEKVEEEGGVGMESESKKKRVLSPKDRLDFNRTPIEEQAQFKVKQKPSSAARKGKIKIHATGENTDGQKTSKAKRPKSGDRPKSGGRPKSGDKNKKKKKKHKEEGNEEGGGESYDPAEYEKYGGHKPYFPKQRENDIDPVESEDYGYDQDDAEEYY